ncbi:uncharacterized protein YktB (UPF0637 family) [Paenibacillus shirakamiensis]|uniref:UPF0637 protein J2Z69_000324 n=1 Tax=Paenibacillus shirakamiensis TaxID=1265935 RepID=A0ABS4JCA5_9BACL|nr:DUF1054 domain-containing protein [Paenibacillus shirakamiensis]MBP1999305.1 uncharacterized protein YktB (UPF0637 family) [Paenibacillus shirakamiensis]
MTFQGFTSQDFDVFTVPGLEARMEVLISELRPKLTELGTTLTPYLSAICGEEMYPHVAKHARRTVNPPHDSWVAWGNSKRGYKALPHFQVGLFSSHVFIIMAVIYESSNKLILAKYLKKHADELKKNIPDYFYWSMDHMDAGGTLHKDLSSTNFKEYAEKLQSVKKSELLCGLRIEREDPILKDGTQLLERIEQTFETLLPLYKASF